MYYENIPDGRLPEIGSRFTVCWERPVDYVDVGSIAAEVKPRGRTLLIFEGESEFVERINAVVAPLITEIRAEIGPA